MEWKDLLAAMGRFGFTDREARFYLFLLRRGRSTARELLRDAPVDRVLAYRTLDAMRARGLVQVTPERPRRYVPIPPGILLERSLLERRRTLEEDAGLAQRLAESLPELNYGPLGGAPRYQLLTGAPSVYPHLREMVRHAQGTLRVMITAPALEESARFGLDTELPAFLGRGGRLWVLHPPTPLGSALARRFGRAGHRYPGAQVRTVDPQPSRVTIVDDREVMVFLVPEASGPGVEEIALWTDTPDFVFGQVAYFKSVWARGRPAIPTSPKAPRGLRPRRVRGAL